MKRRRQFVLGGLAGLGIFGLAAMPIVRAQTTDTSRIFVHGEAVPSPTPHDDWKAKLDHIMSEVSKTEITVTKKASVIKLDQQPPVENNNLQQLFTKAPGLLITEQNTPGQFNLSYRGLGNPQESEFVTVLMDGIPLASDWIGFPTLYYPTRGAECQRNPGDPWRQQPALRPRARAGGQLCDQTPCSGSALEFLYRTDRRIERALPDLQRHPGSCRPNRVPA